MPRKVKNVKNIIPIVKKNARQKFDGSAEPEPDPKGGDCRCLSPDLIIKRDGKKRFADFN